MKFLNILYYFHHAVNMLLYYLYTTHYYCTVNNVVPNNQQTILQFIDIFNTQMVDTLLTVPRVMYATRLRSGLFDLVI